MVSGEEETFICVCLGLLKLVQYKKKKKQLVSVSQMERVVIPGYSGFV